MATKESYEAGKAERKRIREERVKSASNSDKESTEMMNMFDRFVTAVERIADSFDPVNVEK